MSIDDALLKPKKPNLLPGSYLTEITVDHTWSNYIYTYEMDDEPWKPRTTKRKLLVTYE